MSQETVREFYETLKSDEALQEQVKSANDSNSIVQIAAEKGYKFTAQELESVMQEISNTDQLSEEELAAVAGGLKDNCNDYEMKCKGYSKK